MDETLHISRNIWLAFIARCEATGNDPSAVLEKLIRERAAAYGVIAAKAKAVRK
jgi:hypothetical protein